MHIETNDPNRPRLDLAVSGTVEKFAEIRPDRVFLGGTVGTPLTAEVQIAPRKNFPFTIEKITAQSGEFIRFEITQRCTDAKRVCILRVENTKAEKGRYADILYVHTDSALRSTIPVYVTGLIR